MLKTGVLLESKDGGPHKLTHENIVVLQDYVKKESEDIRSSRFLNSDNRTAVNSVKLDLPHDAFGISFSPLSSSGVAVASHQQIIKQKEDGPRSRSRFRSRSRSNSPIQMEVEGDESAEGESEFVGNQTDILQMISKSSANTSPVASEMDSHSIIIGGGSVSENVDFVFSKQTVGSNYFEALENSEYSTSVNNFTGPTMNLTWGSSQESQCELQHIESNSTIQHLSIPNDHEGSFVSFPDATDMLEDQLNLGASSSHDLHSMLFESIDIDENDINKTDSSPGVKIVHITDSTDFIDSNLPCVSETENSLLSNSLLKSVPLTFTNGTMQGMSLPDITLSSLHDVATDLNLNSLPNFLGLESAIGTNSHILDGQGEINMLQAPELSPHSNHSEIKHGNSLISTTKCSQLASQKLNVTTISISNDDENSTKILVDTHLGQKQMYVINTSDLNQSGSTKVNLNQGQRLFLINASNVNQGHDQFSMTTMGTVVQNATAAQSSPALSGQTNADISGYAMMSDADKSTAVEAPTSTGVKESKKEPCRKLLMCTEPGCEKTFKKSSKLKVHQMQHTGERPFKCTILGCEWAFTTSNKLKRHYESHEGRKNFICDKPGCGNRFTTIYNLNTHLKLHERPCTEVCPKKGCNESFPTKRRLELHLRNVHACEDRKFKCPEPGCEKVFFSSSCMTIHMKIHQLSPDDLRCKYPGCGKQFNVLCRLKQHEKLHTGEKPYVCDYKGCNWAFQTASKLKRHLTKHTGDRQWTCYVCEKQFHRSEHLRGHMIIHTGDRPFVCPIEGCGNSFTSKSTLGVHLKKHDESGKIIVYHCPMDKCVRHYETKASLRQHILVKHCNVTEAEGSSQSQGASNWLSLLTSGDGQNDMAFSQESYSEGLTQAALTPSQDTVLTIDFLTGGMAEQALLNSSSESLPDQTSLTSPSISGSAVEVLQHTQKHQQLYPDEQIEARLLEATDILKRERLSSAAVERGKKSQIKLENAHGSARTDPRSNDIISQRALKRWQKQKEVEAARLKFQLEEHNTSAPPVNIVLSSCGDFKNPVSNNVSLAGPEKIHTLLLSKPSDLTESVIKAEIPDMELQADGISESADLFMTDLFIRDPETGITYRQTQLLQDDPPNPEMLEDIGVVPSHNDVLDSSLDVHFVDDTLNFHQLE